jgi:signal transduction histidine kinase
VSDQGPGLAPEDRSRLFLRFAHLSARPTGGESSSGLGLSIVKHLVDANHGKVWVESEQGHGCTFFVEMPSGAPVPAR